MSYESVSRISELTGFAPRTIKRRLSGVTPVVDGRSHTYETKEVLRLLYTDSDQTEYDLNQERARLSFHQANNESMKEKERRGELIPVQLVVELGAGMLSVVRSKLLGAHNKIKSRYVDLSQEVVDEIENIHREALEEMGSSGIPRDIRSRVEKTVAGLESAAESND